MSAADRARDRAARRHRPPADGRCGAPGPLSRGRSAARSGFRRPRPRDVLLVLDQITDPHNVGAIVRSAAAFAVAAIVTTERHSPGRDRRPRQGGLRRARACADRLMSQSRRRARRDGRAGRPARRSRFGRRRPRWRRPPLRGPLALVLGAEDKGLRQRTRGLCDVLARLDMPGAIKSLNVSNAAALALYVAHAQRADRRGCSGRPSSRRRRTGDRGVGRRPARNPCPRGSAAAPAARRSRIDVGAAGRRRSPGSTADDLRPGQTVGAAMPGMTAGRVRSPARRRTSAPARRGARRVAAARAGDTACAGRG